MDNVALVIAGAAGSGKSKLAGRLFGEYPVVRWAYIISKFSPFAYGHDVVVIDDYVFDNGENDAILKSLIASQQIKVDRIGCTSWHVPTPQFVILTQVAPVANRRFKVVQL
jgi:GTPase SAR1 family protein